MISSQAEREGALGNTDPFRFKCPTLFCRTSGAVVLPGLTGSVF